MQSDEPDLELGGFSLWVLGRQFPDAIDEWDGNWLHVRVRVEAPGALIEAEGAFVSAPELADFAKQLGALHTTLAGEAVLRCLEPNLHVALRAKSLGHVSVCVRITPDHMTQSHEFLFEIDQSYLGPLLSACGQVLSRWPVRTETSA